MKAVQDVKVKSVVSISGVYPPAKTASRSPSPVEDKSSSSTANIFTRAKNTLFDSAKKAKGSLTEFVASESPITVPVELPLFWNDELKRAKFPDTTPEFFISFLEWKWESCKLLKDELSTYASLRDLLTEKKSQFTKMTFSITKRVQQNDDTSIESLHISYQFHTEIGVIELEPMYLNPQAKEPVDQLVKPKLRGKLLLTEEDARYQLSFQLEKDQIGMLSFNEGKSIWYAGLLGEANAAEIARDPQRILDAVISGWAQKGFGSLSALLQNEAILFLINEVSQDPANPNNFLIKCRIINPMGKNFSPAFSVHKDAILSPRDPQAVRYSSTFGCQSRGDFDYYFGTHELLRQQQEQMAAFNEALHDTSVELFASFKNSALHSVALDDLQGTLQSRLTACEEKAAVLPLPNLNKTPFAAVDPANWNVIVRERQQFIAEQEALLKGMQQLAEALKTTENENAKKLTALEETARSLAEQERRYQVGTEQVLELESEIAQLDSKMTQIDEQKLELEQQIAALSARVEDIQTSQLQPLADRMQAILRNVDANLDNASQKAIVILKRTEAIATIDKWVPPVIANPFAIRNTPDISGVNVNYTLHCKDFKIKGWFDTRIASLFGINKRYNTVEGKIAAVVGAATFSDFDVQLQALLEELRGSYPLKRTPRFGIRAQCRITELMVMKALGEVSEQLRMLIYGNNSDEAKLQQDAYKIRVLNRITNEICAESSKHDYGFNLEEHRNLNAEFINQIMRLDKHAKDCLTAFSQKATDTRNIANTRNENVDEKLDHQKRILQDTEMQKQFLAAAERDQKEYKEVSVQHQLVASQRDEWLAQQKKLAEQLSALSKEPLLERKAQVKNEISAIEQIREGCTSLDLSCQQQRATIACMPAVAAERLVALIPAAVAPVAVKEAQASGSEHSSPQLLHRPSSSESLGSSPESEELSFLQDSPTTDSEKSSQGSRSTTPVPVNPEPEKVSTPVVSRKMPPEQPEEQQSRGSRSKSQAEQPTTGVSESIAQKSNTAYLRNGGDVFSAISGGAPTSQQKKKKKRKPLVTIEPGEPLLPSSAQALQPWK